MDPAALRRPQNSIRESYMTFNTHFRLGLLAAASVLAAGQAQAGGFYLQEQSVRGAGRAFSGEGADTGAASLWWNPAAIGGMTGIDAYGGASYIRPKGTVSNVGTRIVRPGQLPAPVGGIQDSRNPINDGVLPSGGVAYGLSDRLAVGVVLTSPFSFTTDYGPNSWVRYTADKTALRTVDIQPSVAFQASSAVSIGAAVNVEYSKAALSNALPNLSPLQADGHQTLKGHGWDVGYSVGVQFHQGPLSAGVSFKSRIRHTLDGAVTTAGLLGPLAPQNGQVSTQASFKTPSQVIGSLRYQVTPALTLNGQIVRFGWEKFNAIKLAAPLNVALPENYHNTFSYAVGADYMVTPALTLRAGAQHDTTPVTNTQRDARVPDSSRWNYTGGASFTFAERYTLDAAFGYTDFKNGPINRTTAAYAGTAVQTPILVNGRVHDARALVFSLGGRVHF